MQAGEREHGFLSRLVAWTERHELVRASLLTSTRASDTAPVDVLSDWDVILYVSTVDPFRDPERWLRAFGAVLVRTPLELRDTHGMEELWRGVIYDDGTKVDFTITPAAVLRIIRGEPRLPPGLDLGFRVLVDKDGLTDGLPAPTFTAYIPQKPTAEEFRALVEELWWDTTYVAKYLWRDDLYAAKALLDAEIRLLVLRPMLEWLIEVQSGWTVRPGPFGRGFKRHLGPDVWAAVEATYAGAAAEDTWQALFQTIAVFRAAAEAVAQSLGYDYPHEVDQRMTRYLLAIRDLPNPT